VFVHRMNTDVKLVGDIFVGIAFSQQGEHLVFAPCQVTNSRPPPLLGGEAKLSLKCCQAAAVISSLERCSRSNTALIGSRNLVAGVRRNR
jgi:hypothetical protein